METSFVVLTLAAAVSALCVMASYWLRKEGGLT
jgi:hypothetical protein